MSDLILKIGSKKGNFYRNQRKEDALIAHCRRLRPPDRGMFNKNIEKWVIKKFSNIYENKFI